ncbi:iron ABC transporter substrate-binding protein [Chloroflexota bacterium]|nr:iron ABC transporter substrate-binding protein [Chloroflexota bacterium]
MKNKKVMWLIVGILISTMVLSACSTPVSRSGGTITVTDLIGREVEVPAEVDSVVAIGPGALRLVIYAGGAPSVVGVEQFELNSVVGRPYWLANPDLANLPAIGQGGSNNAPDPEKLLSVNPDVIFSTYATDAASADELQEKTGIPVVVVSYGSIGFGITAIFGEPIQNSLALIGQTLGTEDKAQETIDFILGAKADLEKRTASIPDEGKLSIYVGALGSKGTHGIESTQGQYALLDVISAVNVVDVTGEAGSIMVDKEALLDWDPDVIVIDEGGMASVLEDVEKNPIFYETLSALQNGQVYGQLPYNYYSTNLDTAIADAYYLGTILYPEAFADIDPMAKADEIYMAMVGIAVYDQMAADFGGYGPVTFDLSD